MRIAIIGPGAMGCLFGALFSRRGFSVTLIDHDPERAALLNEVPIEVEDGEESFFAPVRASANYKNAGTFELVLLTVKAPQTRAATVVIPSLLGEKGLLLSLQNGIGTSDILAEVVGPGRLLIGVTAQGATLLGPGNIRYGGRGMTTIGPVKGGNSSGQEVVNVLNQADITASWAEDVTPHIWKKLAANCGINAVTALTGAKNLTIATDPNANALARAATLEVARVASALEINLGDPEELAKWVIDVARATAKNRSSMGQDVDLRRATEIEFINGSVARLGTELGIATPVNQTLTRLVLTMTGVYGV
jgi:2-dehydropantoate 2-reductase